MDIRAVFSTTRKNLRTQIWGGKDRSLGVDSPTNFEEILQLQSTDNLLIT